MQTLRLNFCKQQEARYISHLDLYRCFSRAIKRSKLEIWYTEGFNSHMYLTFPLPLSLGFESICEIVEFRLLEQHTNASEIVDRINPYLPNGIEIYNCARPVMKAKEISFARYLIEIEGTPKYITSFADAIAKTFGQDAISVKKTGKKGKITTTDIKPQILSHAVEQRDEKLLLDITVCAGSEQNLNPMLLLTEVFAAAGAEPERYLVKRTQILNTKFENFE